MGKDLNNVAESLSAENPASQGFKEFTEDIQAAFKDPEIIFEVLCMA